MKRLFKIDKISSKKKARKKNQLARIPREMPGAPLKLNKSDISKERRACTMKNINRKILSKIKNQTRQKKFSKSESTTAYYGSYYLDWSMSSSRLCFSHSSWLLLKTFFGEVFSFRFALNSLGLKGTGLWSSSKVFSSRPSTLRDIFLWGS